MSSSKTQDSPSAQQLAFLGWRPHLVGPELLGVFGLSPLRLCSSPSRLGSSLWVLGSRSVHRLATMQTQQQSCCCLCSVTVSFELLAGARWHVGSAGSVGRGRARALSRSGAGGGAVARLCALRARGGVNARVAGPRPAAAPVWLRRRSRGPDALSVSQARAFLLRRAASTTHAVAHVQPEPKGRQIVVRW